MWSIKKKPSSALSAFSVGSPRAGIPQSNAAMSAAAPTQGAASASKNGTFNTVPFNKIFGPGATITNRTGNPTIKVGGGWNNIMRLFSNARAVPKTATPTPTPTGAPSA